MAIDDVNEKKRILTYMMMRLVDSYAYCRKDVLDFWSSERFAHTYK